ncbi:MAG TPA: MFS transporter [Acetobacteraceae bacterium]|nr:MFS transporter [Acetobacteraceae bacterium]
MSELTTGIPRPGAAVSMGSRLRSIFGGSIGNLIEWYDFYVYNAFALYFAKQFSPPSTSASAQFVTVFGIYAVGFLIRPIGGYFLGTMADLRGRKAALTLSVTLMCAGSLIIAVLPSYAAIGVAAPLLLLFARLLQGFSLGGEYASSATYLSEVATSKHRGFYSSFQYVTLIGGQVLGSATLLVMQALFTAPQLEDWGWRVPFLLGAACALFGLYLRRRLIESPEFMRAARTPRTRSPFRELLQHKKEFFLVLGLTMGGTTAFYTYSTYMPTFLVNTVKLTRDQATQISFITLVIYACMQPLFGVISDVVGRRPVLLWFGILGTIFTVPLLTALAETRDYTTALLLILAALAIVSGYTSINAVVKAELFPASVRAIGVGLPYAIAASLFGGTAPYVALELKQRGVESAFYWYVSALILVSLIVYATMRDTKKRSLILTD